MATAVQADTAAVSSSFKHIFLFLMSCWLYRQSTHSLRENTRISSAKGEFGGTAANRKNEVTGEEADPDSAQA